ncbi:MAG: cobalamin-dependent protein [Nanoarchaeota archaeon]|nr:cobalamin-dependent protein [Nanoarchaeota archaeon]MBU1321801.1 cobalamin-dependent protein [Nanoarchaeota archaeon]MBU1598248.1 cobalamin-dependent protein [Nanoarchaeota archaeon]MBU2441723.1 cobalamin-dependent protein [Nanoarchaeota archaeon]
MESDKNSNYGKKNLKNKISLIIPPFSFSIKFESEVKNYGVSRLLYKLIKDTGLDKNEISAYDFSRLYEVKEDKEINNLCDTLEESEFYAFSVLDKNYPAAIKMAEHLKNKYPDSKIIVGGSTAAELGEEILEAFEHIDYVCFSMGEDTLDGLLSSKELSKIPNLIWREKNNKKEERIIRNEMVFPPSNWENLYPADFKWNNLNDDAFDYRVIFSLGALGCGGKCNYCTIREKEPVYTRRPLDSLVNEIKFQINTSKKHGVDKVEVHITDEYPTPRLNNLFRLLKEKDLIKDIDYFMFDCRADMVSRSLKMIEKVVTDYPLVNFIHFTGFENFSDNILIELNKGISAKENLKALQLLEDIQKEHENFFILPSFITLTPNTKKKDLKTQINVIKDHFLDYDMHYDRFLNILQLGNRLGPKYGLNRKKGYLLEDNSGNQNLEGYLGFPKDKEMIDVLNKFAQARDKIPLYEDRMKLKNLLSDNGLLYRNAEILILDRIVNDNKYEDIVKEVNELHKAIS